ncbi:hypothetical protein NHX12_021542 [Muraenolepis orangiensis]|uniref:Uncharacterized protein n=1 Tax=Muraenolepis orangiensis TaxID=630683 RepID=A0A9Q0EQ76_9TELE|nr:hypothetical protein NHX12_021542 [Muraenolepis orangiensis]
MASLYQRFAGTVIIDTNKSFPPEASRLLLLLGQQGVDEEDEARTAPPDDPAPGPGPGPGPESLRHRFQRHREDEDVRMN